MEEDRQLLGVHGSSKRPPANSSLLRFLIVVLVLVLIVAASAIIGMLLLCAIVVSPQKLCYRVFCTSMSCYVVVFQLQCISTEPYTLCMYTHVHV